MQKIFGLGLLAFGFISQAADTPIQMPSQEKLYARLSKELSNPAYLSKKIREDFLKITKLHEHLGGELLEPIDIATQINQAMEAYRGKNKVHHSVMAFTVIMLKKEVCSVVFGGHQDAFVYLEGTGAL